MFLWGTGFANFMDASEPMSFFVSTQRPQIKRMDVPEYDALMAQAKVELDPDKTDQFLQDAAVILREEAPLIFLFNQGYSVSVHKNVQDLQIRVDNVILFEHVTVVK